MADDADAAPAGLAFDHVNLRTANLDAMVAWYGEVLGLRPGPRPPFDFGGAWLYLGGRALLHLVRVDRRPEARDPALEHVAFRASGLGAFAAKLKSRGVAYRVGTVPGLGTVQLNLSDPDGNHLHVDFGPEERAALDAG